MSSRNFIVSGLIFMSLIYFELIIIWASLIAQLVKNPPAMQGILVWFRDWEDSLEKGYSWTSLVAPLVKSLPAGWDTWVQSLGWEDPLEKGKATHSSILAWRIPWTVSSLGLQTVGHNWVTFTFNYYIWYKVMAQFYSFACGYPVFLAQCWKHYSLPFV